MEKKKDNTQQAYGKKKCQATYETDVPEQKKTLPATSSSQPSCFEKKKKKIGNIKAAS